MINSCLVVPVVANSIPPLKESLQVKIQAETDTDQKQDTFSRICIPHPEYKRHQLSLKLVL